MKRLRPLLPLLLTVGIVFLLNRPLGVLPALGCVLDPVNGAMAAAEKTDRDWTEDIRLGGLNLPVQIWVDSSLIPHIRAGNDHDLYYTQGYIHARFRLWQMDMQTRAAGGRISEVAGFKAVEFDRGMRREGMVWGAKRSLAAMEAEPRTKAMLDAYRDGINACSQYLSYRNLPLEYKLMGFRPEPWTNLRTALLMKYMARDLTGKTDDIVFTQLRDALGQQEFDFLFPERIAGSKPVIPEGTSFAAPSLKAPVVPSGNIWAHFGGLRSAASKVPASSCAFAASANSALARAFTSEPDAIEPKGGQGVLPVPFQETGDAVVGSNNWAISGKHTVSGKPILCNDPHLGLNLPALWFEMQLTAPGVNVYGASLPGAPGIVIGFNERISWGFTNNYRDVKDFYRITSLPINGGGYAAYVFGGKTVPFGRSVERIRVKGGADVLDTVLYTVHGPVTYDSNFLGPDSTGALLACTWMGHRGSNELLSIYLLNRAGNYEAFTRAIRYFECPAQNFAYADGAGNIAMWGQGRFINKWKDQGKYVMEGRDSSTLWGDDIPMEENPHMLNPSQGYLVSANQQVTDSAYPYWYNGSFTEWRSWDINRWLDNLGEAKASMERLDVHAMQPTDVDWDIPWIRGPRLVNGDYQETIGMQELQNDCRGIFPSVAWTGIAEFYPGRFSKQFCQRYLSVRENSGFMSDPYNYWPEYHGGTIRQVGWYFFTKAIWGDEGEVLCTRYPPSEVTVMRIDTSYYYDDKRTQAVETRRDILEKVIRQTIDSLDVLKRTVGLQWYRVKNTTLMHLAKIPAFSYDHLKIGGWSNTINAVTGNHGPSWRMIVEMDSIPKAYTIYPGGQSGNPGSRHYGDFIDAWVDGRYHEVHFLVAAQKVNPLPYTWTLHP